MKKAVLVIGRPNAGKSTTIREFLKLVETDGLHVFMLNGNRGFTWLTSFEEYDRDVDDTVGELSGNGYDFLLFACQGPKLADAHRALKKASFVVGDVHVQHPTEAPEKAKEILKFFKSNVTK